MKAAVDEVWQLNQCLAREVIEITSAPPTRSQVLPVRLFLIGLIIGLALGAIATIKVIARH